MIQLGRLHHCSLVITNMEATRHFYCDILGMEEVERPPAFTFQGQWFRKNGCEIHTIYKDEATQVAGDALNTPRPAQQRDITFARHFCFSIENLAGTLKVLADNGVEIVAGPRPRSDGATQLYFYDPDGHLIELVHDPSP